VTLQVDRHKFWTYEDSLSLPSDGQRYEILDGVLYVSPSPSSLHQILSRRLQFFFYQFEQEGLGYIFNAPKDLLMPGCTPVQPDLIYLSRDQRGHIRDKYLQGVPHLVAEILSPSTRSLDRVKKLNRFAQNGVPTTIPSPEFPSDGKQLPARWKYRRCCCP
jgi:Uma2 family endonuclease